MFAKATFILTALVAVVAAGSVTNQCNTGSVQCCNTRTTASNSRAASIIHDLALVGIGANVPVGLDCSPIDVVGVGSGSTCTANPVCCKNIYSNGLLGVDCSPVNANL